MRSCLLTFSWPNTTSMLEAATPNWGARKRTMWSVALPSLGAAVTLTLSCVPLGLPMASLLAEGLPRILTIRVSPSQAKKESPVALRGRGADMGRMILLPFSPDRVTMAVLPASLLHHDRSPHPCRITRGALALLGRLEHARFCAARAGRHAGSTDSRAAGGRHRAAWPASAAAGRYRLGGWRGGCVATPSG